MQSGLVSETLLRLLSRPKEWDIMEVFIAIEWIVTLAWLYWLIHDRWPTSRPPHLSR